MTNDINSEVSLREYIDLRFTNLDSAILLSTAEMNRRLEGLNNLRDEVTKDREQLVQKTVYETEIKEIHKEIAAQGKVLIMQGEDIKNLQKDVGVLVSSQTWLVRIVAGAILSGIILVIVARLT